MSEKKPNPLIKTGLELGPIVIFFLAYRWAPVIEGASDEDRQLSQILFATQVFIPVILVSLVASWFLLKELPKMAIVTAVVVVVFGGLTLWLRDPTFIKMKPTVIYLTFGAILAWGLRKGQSYLAYVMDAAIPMTHEGWMIFTKRFAMFFVVLAIANEAIWRSFDTDTWVNFKTFGLPVAMFSFLIFQAKIFEKYALPEEEKKD